MIGTTLSHYAIISKLGQGGMGEVYRARDSKLNREVAIKVLPEAFAQDAERLARFQREAQVLASLNHPNIAAMVKVLDFGLAKISSNETPSDDLSHSPTLIKGTQAGMILGTAAYMSPEQAKGKIVDKRTDVWAFGCVLFEIITGKQAFSGETLTDTLAAVVRADPDWSALPIVTPEGIRRLLRRCLNKDQKQRLRDIGEARITIESFQAGKSEEITELAIRKEPLPLRKTLLWVAGIALAFIAGGIGMLLLRPASSEIPLRKLELQIAGLELSGSYGYSISPNGRTIAYVWTGTTKLGSVVR